MRKVLRNLLNWLDKRAAKKELERIEFSKDLVEDHFKKFISVLIDNNYLDLNDNCISVYIWYHKSDNSFRLDVENEEKVKFKLQDAKEEN